MRHVFVVLRTNHAALTGLVNEQRVLQIAQVVNGSHGRRMAAGKWLTGFVEPISADIDGEWVAWAGLNHIQPFRQKWRLTQRPVAADGLVCLAPLPMRQILALLLRQTVQSTCQSFAGLVSTGFRRTPPSVLLGHGGFQETAEMPLAVLRLKQLLAQLGFNQSAGQFICPVSKNQGSCVLGLHFAIETLQYLHSSGC